MKHHDLLHSWGHGKLARHMARGGRAEDFNKHAPDEGDDGQGAEALRRELNELTVDLPKPTQTPKPSMSMGGKVRRFDDGGYVDPMGATSSEVEPEDAEFMRRLAKKISEQVGKEVKLIATPSGAKDFLLNHVSAPIAGGMSDIANMGLEGVDYLREQAAKQNKRGYRRESVMGGDMVPPTVKPYASEKPFMGSDQFRDAFERQGVTKGQDQTPITGMVGDVFANPLGALTAVKAVSKTGKALKSIKNGMK